MKEEYFTPSQLEKFANDKPDTIWCVTNDGQGDTYMDSLEELVDDFNLDNEEDETHVKCSYYHYMSELFWEDTSGNMSFFISIENNTPYKIVW